MKSPVYLIPKSVKEALQLLSKPVNGTVILAGGTDVIVELRESRLKPVGVETNFAKASSVKHFQPLPPNRIIDISRIQELKEIKEKSDYIELGALVTHRELAESKLIRKYGNILAEAAIQMGSPQVCNRGTLGGNLATASPAADTAPPLIALGAKVLLKSLNSQREVPIEDFFLAPGKTILNPNELILGVRFTKIKKTEYARYCKLGQRNAVSISIVSIAIKAELKNIRFGPVRIGLGSVAPKPIRALEAERILSNQPFNDKIIAQAAQAVMTQCSTITDLRATGEYRCRMVKELTQKLLKEITNIKNRS
ncbi:MAG: xanthine dehydrogenase family protein subunit M [bacterium]|nr:xanthine dehydrogenase family protein subunit M [bacterium]